MSDPSKEISPKVIASGITGIAITLVLAVIAAITPDAFSFLGPWSPVAYLALETVGVVIAGWAKRDPSRQAIVLPPIGVIPPVQPHTVTVIHDTPADAPAEPVTKTPAS